MSVNFMSVNFMSVIFMSVNFMPGHFDGPSFSCPSFSAPPSQLGTGPAEVDNDWSGHGRTDRTGSAGPETFYRSRSCKRPTVQSTKESGPPPEYDQCLPGPCPTFSQNINKLADGRQSVLRRQRVNFYWRCRVRRCLVVVRSVSQLYQTIIT